MSNEIIATKEATKVQTDSLLKQLAINYGDKVVLAIGGFITTQGWISHDQYIKWSPLVITLILVLAHGTWRRLNQHYKDIARSILPTDATLADINTLAKELNPVRITDTTTTITPGGEINVTTDH